MQPRLVLYIPAVLLWLFAASALAQPRPATRPAAPQVAKYVADGALDGEELNVAAIRFSPDGRQILTRHENTNSALVWDAATGKLLATLPMRNRIVSAEYSPDGKRILLASRDRVLNVYDAKLASTRPTATTRPHNADFYAWFCPDSGHIVTNSTDGTVRLFAADTARREGEFLPGRRLTERDEPRAASAVAVSADGKRIVTAMGGVVRIFDAASGKLWVEREIGGSIARIELGGTSDAMNVDLFTHRAVSTFESVLVVSYHLCRGERLEMLREAKIRDALPGRVAVSPNRRDVAVARSEIVEDRPTRHVVHLQGPGNRQQVLDRHRSEITHVQFSGDGRRLVSVTDARVEGARGPVAIVWDVESGAPLAEIPEQRALLVAFSPDLSRAVVMLGDGSAKLWRRP